MDRKFQSKTYLSTRQISELQRELQNDIPNAEPRDWLVKLYLRPAKGPDWHRWHVATVCLDTLQALVTQIRSHKKAHPMCGACDLQSQSSEIRFWHKVEGVSCTCLHHLQLPYPVKTDMTSLYKAAEPPICPALISLSSPHWYSQSSAVNQQKKWNNAKSYFAGLNQASATVLKKVRRPRRAKSRGGK